MSPWLAFPALCFGGFFPLSGEKTGAGAGAAPGGAGGGSGQAAYST